MGVKELTKDQIEEIFRLANGYLGGFYTSEETLNNIILVLDRCRNKVTNSEGAQVCTKRELKMHDKKPKWEFGVPAGSLCYDPSHDFFNLPLATWTLLNPCDGGEPIHLCQECKDNWEE